MIKVSKGRCPKALDDSADFSVVCQFGRFTYAFCYQFLMILRGFGIFRLDRTGFFIFRIPESRDIVQVMQIVQIDLKKFRFTEPGSNLAFVLKNIAHNDAKRPCNRICVIKVFGGVFVLSRCFLDCSVGVGVFVTGLSQISSFFSYKIIQ